jgi:hypothetical protein
MDLALAVARFAEIGERWLLEELLGLLLRLSLAQLALAFERQAFASRYDWGLESAVTPIPSRRCFTSAGRDEQSR